MSSSQTVPATPNPSPVLRSSRPFPAWLASALLALAAIALYWPALHEGFVNYDDDRYVTANPDVQKGLTFENFRWSFTHPVADNWHPLTVLSHMLVCQLWGLNPLGHHLVNVLLHAANVVLIFLCLRQLTGATLKSFAVAALFAVHPLHVESVAWVAERKDVLSAFFALLALMSYAAAARSKTVANGNRKLKNGRKTAVVGSRAILHLLTLLFFTLGLLSKPMLVTWPFVFLLLDYWPLKRFPNYELSFTIFKSLVIEKIPLFALAAAASVVAFLVQKKGDAIETIANLTLAARCENALVSYCRYLGKLFWPSRLAVFYPHPGHWPAAEVLLAGGLLLAVSGVAVVQRRRYPYLLVGWLWFLGALVPVIGLIQVGLQSMADRYTYLPSLGILILVVWGVDAWTRYWPLRTVPLAAVAALAVIFCAMATRAQLGYWQDGVALFRHAIEVTENNYIAHYNLGVALDGQDRGREAMTEYQAALQIQPDFARAHVNLGRDLDTSGETNAAMREYQAAIRVAPGNAFARNNLGIALFKRGRIEEATTEFEESVRLAPGNASARNSFAAALYTQGRTNEAVFQFQEALRLKPDYAEAHYNLACVLIKLGQAGEAARQFEATLRLKPDYPEARARLAEILPEKHGGVDAR